jgi:hypothetical protein
MNTQFPEAPTAENTPDKSITLADLTYLWQVDDAGWLAQRKADWLTYIKPVFKDYPKSEQKLLEQYFTLGIKNEYYPESDWFFLTPYDSVGDFIKIINSSLLGPHERGNVLSGFVTKFKRFELCPWYKKYLLMYIEVYLCSGFVIVEEKEETISPMPTFWTFQFVKDSLSSIKENKNWSPLYFCVDYFVSILPFAFRAKRRERIGLTQLMQLVDEKLEQGDLTGDLLNFVTALKAREQDIFAAWDIGEQKIAAGMKAPRE